VLHIFRLSLAGVTEEANVARALASVVIALAAT